MPIQLPALDIRPAQQTDPLEQVGKVLSLKSLLQQQKMQPGQLQLQQQQITAGEQENQIRARQIQDQQAQWQSSGRTKATWMRHCRS
jgi:hypothetical protein